jgi:bifunctional non-homologous end joining protein LigD
MSGAASSRPQSSSRSLARVLPGAKPAPYRSGRTEAWVKVKCWKRDLFVVVSFVPDGAGGLAKLRLARREARALVYAGRVGTGWDHKTARAVRAALAPLARSTSPLSKSIKKKDTTWVEPRYDAEVTYADITDDGMVRHPSFKRLVCNERRRSSHV